MSGGVAVVSGSNKGNKENSNWQLTKFNRLKLIFLGIGFAIVRALCKQFSGDVYLTSRDEGRGLEAVELLKKVCLEKLCNFNSLN